MSHFLSDASSVWHRYRTALSLRTTEGARHRPVASYPALARRERVLRRYEHNGQRLVATDRALYERPPGDAWRRLSWADIAIVGWSRVEHAVVLRLWHASPNEPDLRITGDFAVAAFVEDRVAAARVLVRHVELRAGLVGTVVAVRDGGDDIRWQLLVAGREPHAPELREIGERLIAEIRGIAGC